MLLEKLGKLVDYFRGNKSDTQDLNTLLAWTSEAKRLFLIKSLKDHDGIKYVLEIFEGEVRKINECLLKEDSKTLSDYRRDRLLDRRDLAQKYIDLFIPIDDKLDGLEETVDKELDTHGL